MILLLCPDCLQWREPRDASCPICNGRLDQYLPDLMREDVANGIGDGIDCLGECDVVRATLPRRGLLHLTTNGMLFVPHRSVVFSFDVEPMETSSTRHSTGEPGGVSPRTNRESPVRGLTPPGSPETRQALATFRRMFAALAMPMRRLHSWLTRSGGAFVIGQSRPLKVDGHDRFALADLLMSDPGVLFVARASIVSWRRQRRRWEFLRTDARWLPERFSPRARDGGLRLQQWLENTACLLNPLTP